MGAQTIHSITSLPWKMSFRSMETQAISKGAQKMYFRSMETHIGDILSSDEPLSLRLALQHIVHLRERCGFKAILMAVPQHHLQLPIQRLIQPCCIGHRVAMPRRGKTKCTIRWCFGIRAPCSSRIRTMCLLSKSHIS